MVPGVSSALAAPASAGIPVTHRELSSSLTIVTGHEDPTKPESAVDWDWLAASNGTLVILMGLSQLPGIRDRLIAGGRSPETPAAAIASGTRPDQRVVSALWRICPRWSPRRNSSLRRSSLSATSSATASCWRHPR